MIKLDNDIFNFITPFQASTAVILKQIFIPILSLHVYFFTFSLL